MFVFVVKDPRNYILCNAMCAVYPDKLSGVTYEESVVTNYYANYDMYIHINTKHDNRYKGRNHMSFVDDWSLVEDMDECVVLSKSNIYTKFVKLCEHTGIQYEEPKPPNDRTSMYKVREDDTAVIEFMEYHDVKYELVDDAPPHDLPTLLYDLTYYTTRS